MDICCKFLSGQTWEKLTQFSQKSLKAGKDFGQMYRVTQKNRYIQSGRSSLAKHGGAYFSAVNGSIQDLIAAPGPYENQEP